MNHLPTQSQQRGQVSLLNAALFALPTAGQLARHLFAAFCLIAFGLLSFNAVAADADAANSSLKDQSPIVVNLKQFKVVKDEKGEPQLVDASLVLPGDVIEYRASYTNRSKAAVPVVATMPIPESMEYIKESANAKGGIAHTVALKDSQFSNEPLLRKVATASGATLSQPLPYSSYRYVRWDLGRLSPGNSVEVSVRAKVSQNLDADASVEDKVQVLTSSVLKK